MRTLIWCGSGWRDHISPRLYHAPIVRPALCVGFGDTDAPGRSGDGNLVLFFAPDDNYLKKMKSCL